MYQYKVDFNFAYDLYTIHQLKRSFQKCIKFGYQNLP